MKRHYARGYRYILLVILAVLMQACGGGTTEVQTPDEVVKLTVVMLPFMSHAPLFIAGEEGYYAEQGLEVEFKEIHGVEAAISLSRGEVDVVAAIVSVSVMALMEDKEDVKIVADKSYVSPTGCAVIALIARPELVDNGELDNVAQLEGRKIALDPVSLDGYYLDKLLATAGLTLDDIEIVQLPSPPSELEALGNGAIDLSASSEPWVTRTNSSGNSVTWKSFQELMPDFQWAIILYGPNLLGENPDVGQRFMTAYLKAVQQLNEGKTERNVELMIAFTGMDEDLVKQACWPSFRDDGSINVESVITFQEWAFDQGFVDGILSAEDFWDASFVEYASGVLE